MVYQSKLAKLLVVPVLFALSCSQKDEDGGGYSGAAGTKKPGTNTTASSANESGKLEKDPTFNSAAYFESTLLPLFKASCETCHVGPRVDVDPRGPQTIYSEETMAAMLADGASAYTNKLILKVADKVNHTGGDRCGGSMENSPCKDIIKWWELYFNKSASEAVGLFGEFSQVTLDGTVTGYAVDTSDKAKVVTVELYVGGPYDQGGVSLGMTNANKGGYDNNNGGTHMFQLKIPDAQIVSGGAAKVYGYTFDGTTRDALLNSPYDFTAYVGKAEATYNAEIASFVGACNQCHGPPSYKLWFYPLLNPPPHKGGSPTNNNFYIRASGTGHPGGNVCAGNTLCTGIQNWWNAEFQ